MVEVHQQPFKIEEPFLKTIWGSFWPSPVGIGALDCMLILWMIVYHSVRVYCAKVILEIS